MCELWVITDGGNRWKEGEYSDYDEAEYAAKELREYGERYEICDRGEMWPASFDYQNEPIYD
jgi:hypothetical protein